MKNISNQIYYSTFAILYYIIAKDSEGIKEIIFIILSILFILGASYCSIKANKDN